MAKSGSYTITKTTEEIIKGAWRLLGLIRGDDTRSAKEMSDAIETLDMMVSEWQADGMGLWLRKEATLFLDKGVQSFNIGPTGDHCTTSSGDTHVAEAASSGDSTITVDSDDGILDNDIIGIELESGDFQWTAVNGTPADDVVTLDDVLTDDVAEDAFVVYYTTKIQRPLSIENVRLLSPDGTETPLGTISRREYMAINDKDSESQSIDVYFDPQTDNAVFYVWPTASDVEYRILFTATLPIQLFSDRSYNPDLPQEWLLCLKYNLASLIGDEYTDIEVSPNKMARIISKAQYYYDRICDFDQEQESVFFEPDMTGY